MTTFRLCKDTGAGTYTLSSIVVKFSYDSEIGTVRVSINDGGGSSTSTMTAKDACEYWAELVRKGFKQWTPKELI